MECEVDRSTVVLALGFLDSSSRDFILKIEQARMN